MEGKAAQAAGTGYLWNCLSGANLVHFNEGSLSPGGVSANTVILIFGTEERRVNCLLCHNFKSQADAANYM